jgi:hypothetical protein
MRGFNIVVSLQEKITTAPRHWPVAMAAHVAATSLHGQRRATVFQ